MWRMAQRGAGRAIGQLGQEAARTCGRAVYVRYFDVCGVEGEAYQCTQTVPSNARL
jgi:hypothetical protein